VKRPRLTIRGRLTLVYGGLFLLAGVLLLAVTYVLVSARLPDPGQANNRLFGTGTSPAPWTTPAPDPDASPGSLNTRGVLMLVKFQQETRDSALNSLLTQGAIALVVVGAVAVAFGWLLAGRLLQPLHQITETARRIADAPAADRGLHERIALRGPPDEVKRLADTFDLMLERLDRSFDGQSRFIANASHELRTPLTLNRTIVEVALDESDSPAVQQLGTTLLAINARHERLIEGLLLLARSEREVLEQSYVDLADVVAHVAAQASTTTVSVHTETAEAPTTGDPILLERLVQNLVENGVRHNVGEGGWVRVSTATRPDGTVTLQVSNTGPVVPRYDIPSVFEPFRRLDNDRLSSPSSGAGLGLSIVRAVAHAHGGEVHAEPRDSGGLVITVTLPAAL
jgi:signal transduction histidine kinase